MRQINRLTTTAIRGISKDGLYPDGGNLYLRVGKGRRWVFIFQWQGKRREMGLGSLQDVSLKDARTAAEQARLALRNGIDPLAARKAEEGRGKTFGDVADAFIADKKVGWRNAKHRQQWTNTLATYAKDLRPIPVAEISTADVLKALKPIWTTKPETASRVRGRIENVLDAAKAQGLRTGENPAAWRGNLAHLLPKRSKLTRGHHRALPYEKAPEFWAALNERTGVAAKALQFTILTCARTSETLGARWAEIDFEKAIWIIPAGRMKMAEVHRVPLCPAAIQLLREVELLAGEHVFPGNGKATLSAAAMDALLKRMKVDATVHGFRSTFRDWAGDSTSHPREVVEAALAHKVGDSVERAYRRGDALSKRRGLMTDWASFLCGGVSQAQPMG